MNFDIGMKVMVKEPILGLRNGHCYEVIQGTICKVIDIGDSHVILNSDNDIISCLNFDMCEKYLTEYGSKSSSAVSKLIAQNIEDSVENILEHSVITSSNAYNHCFVLNVKFPNGYIATESYSFTSLEEYDADYATHICMANIKNRLREMEKYRLQDELFRGGELCDKEDVKE